MDFLKKLFGGKKVYYEKDNQGTRHDTEGLATAYWIARQTSSKKDPFVLYSFETEAAARAAMMELPCIHVAVDSGKLVCSEVLIFGVYPGDAGRYEAIVAGDDLTHELWEQAKASFTKHGGKPRGQGDQEPEKRAAPAKAAKPKEGKVTFVREDRQQKMGNTFIYRIHRGPDAASARAFLEKNPVTQQLYYIIVETPEGNYCRDIQGIYKE